MSIHIERAALAARPRNDRTVRAPIISSERLMMLVAVVAMSLWWGAILFVALGVLRHGMD